MENYIIDAKGHVLPINTQLIDHTKVENYTVELNKFNLEINYDPVPLAANAFSQLQAQMDGYMSRLRKSAEAFDARIIPIGILPTLMHQDLSHQSMTDLPRYRSLSEQLFKMRGEHFKVHIRGDEELFLTSDHV